MATKSTNKRRKGAELLEFTLALLPMLIMMFVLLDAAWGMYVKSTLMYAVRVGVRVGITITGTQAAGTNLTAMVKSTVQANAMGLLAGSAGLAKIRVNYLQPPAPNSNANPIDVSGQNNGNVPGNIMQVSIQGFNLGPLVPRLFSWKERDVSTTAIGAVAADLIEPSRDLPAIGTAP